MFLTKIKVNVEIVCNNTNSFVELILIIQGWWNVMLLPVVKTHFRMEFVKILSIPIDRVCRMYKTWQWKFMAFNVFLTPFLWRVTVRISFRGRHTQEISISNSYPVSPVCMHDPHEALNIYKTLPSWHNNQDETYLCVSVWS